MLVLIFQSWRAACLYFRSTLFCCHITVDLLCWSSQRCTRPMSRVDTGRSALTLVTMRLWHNTTLYMSVWFMIYMFWLIDWLIDCTHQTPFTNTLRLFIPPSPRQAPEALSTRVVRLRLWVCESVFQLLISPERTEV